MSCARVSSDAATNKTRFFSAKIVRYFRLHTQHATEVTAMEKSASGQDASHRDAATSVLFLALALGALWFVCCRHLSEEWRFNEQYSYGWFVPFFVAYLFWLRWEDRPGPEVGG